MALPNADPTKISKLQQRFIAPSNFSTDYLFPGVQIFFKDFIIATEFKCTFVEQLKTFLCSELVEMNDSSYETLTLTANGKAANGAFNEYVVRPETLSTMRVLAKFLGFVLARPHQYEGPRNTEMDNRQIQLRNAVSRKI